MDLAEYYGISPEGAHRALNDCRMNQQVYERMVAEIRKKRAIQHEYTGLEGRRRTILASQRPEGNAADRRNREAVSEAPRTPR